jgi:hypothetical protein
MCRAVREGLSAKSSFTVRFPSCSQDALLVRLHGSAACTPVAALMNGMPVSKSYCLVHSMSAICL